MFRIAIFCNLHIFQLAILLKTTMNQDIKIESTWKEHLGEYFNSEQFINLSNFIRTEYLTKKVYPEPKNIFKAFWLTPFNKVKVVILGQDPYHGPGQAEGLSFSVPDGVKLPPSLQNIYKEIEINCGYSKDFTKGSLSNWAEQGVFLLNAILSVVAGQPTSHQGHGWEPFTDNVIKTLSDKKNNLVFMLWGNYARSKKSLIDKNRHLILEAAHPSPLSAYSGFFGCKHFSQCNNYLKKHGQEEINW